MLTACLHLHQLVGRHPAEPCGHSRTAAYSSHAATSTQIRVYAYLSEQIKNSPSNLCGPSRLGRAYAFAWRASVYGVGSYISYAQEARAWGFLPRFVPA